MLEVWGYGAHEFLFGVVVMIIVIVVVGRVFRWCEIVVLVLRLESD